MTVAEEIRSDERDHAFWSEFGSLLGWRLCEWEYQSNATFFDGIGKTIRISGAACNDILDAIRRAALANGGGE